MASPKLQNYLRSYRTRAGLLQRDVAFILGCESGEKVSRYEKRRRLPPLETALAYEAVFGVPVAELFAGLRDTVGRQIQRRLGEFGSRLQAKDVAKCKKSEARLVAHKLRWLAGRLHTEPLPESFTA